MAARGARRPGRAPTISDVAARAGVSPMTVSRVINGEGHVRPATRERVAAAVAELNYSPNPAARSLAGAEPIRIGLLFSNPSAAYLSAFLVGGLDQASRSGVQLVVQKCEPGEHEGEVAAQLLAGGVDGLILPPPLCDNGPVLAALAASGRPGVAVATARAADGHDTVGIDDHRAAFAMTRHIAALGHRRIGFVGGSPDQTASARRLAGYRDALAAAGLPHHPELEVDGFFTYHSGLDAAERLLDLPEPPSAIFASNDDMAAAAVAVAHRHGLDVPGDLSVCGFDDTALATTIWPELTTIRQPIGEMSRIAVERLADAVRRARAGQAPEGQLQRLDFTLVRRQSDAPPRRRPPAKGAHPA